MKTGNRVASAGELAGGFLRALKARSADGEIWSVRGKVFARVMVAGRDAKLSGGELRVLLTVALHLQHLGRSKGMMTVKSLADDAMVTERTVRNALRVLEAAKFLKATFRASGQMALMLDRRFHPKALVPACAQAVDKSPRRSAARKKISTNRTSTYVDVLLKRQCKDSPAAKKPAASEFPASIPTLTAAGNAKAPAPASWNTTRPLSVITTRDRLLKFYRISTSPARSRGPAPPRKRA